MAIPKPKPGDWLKANAQELQVTDREVLALLRATKKRVDEILRDLPEGTVTRAQLENSRATLLAEQSTLFTKLGDVVAARRASAASRAARISAASNAALLSLVGKSEQAQFLYDSALKVSQRAIDAALQRMKYSALPLSSRIYNSNVWMNGRLGKLINETLASGLNAREFTKRARDWFSPNTPGGVRYAAMRLARTEINNAFHSMSAQKYAETPWITEVEWNLSGSHLKPDICNEYAAASPYPSDETPARPHPQCLCYITPKSIEEDEFIDNFLKGDYDEYLDAELKKNGWDEPENDDKREKAAAEPTPEPVLERRTLTRKEQEQTAEDFAFGGANGSGSLGLNAALRGQKPMTPEERDLMDRMDIMFRDVEPTKAYQTVYRVISGDKKLRTELVSIARKRGTYSDPAFLSTSKDKSSTEDFMTGNEDVLIQIAIPPGSSVLDLDGLLDFNKPGVFEQNEIVLNRGSVLNLSHPEKLPDGTWRIIASLGKPSPQAAVKAVKAVDKRAEEQYQPDSLFAHPELPDYVGTNFANKLFGRNNETLESARSNGPAENFDKMDAALLQQLKTSTYLPSKLQYLRSLDDEYARRTGKDNDHFFEKEMVNFLTTPEGVRKSQDSDAKMLEEAKQFESLDALSKAARELNGGQPALPADSDQFKPMSESDANEFWNRSLKDKPLSSAEQSGLRYYSTTPGYTNMNQKLRTGKDPGGAKEKAKTEEGIPNTRNGLRPLDRPVLVRRETGSGQFTQQGGDYRRLESMLGLTGKTFTDKGFTSTSISDSGADSKEIGLEIEVPAGVPAAYMEGLTRHKGEKELLLSDGLEFKVLRAEYDPKGNEGSGRVNLRVRVIDWPGRIKNG